MPVIGIHFMNHNLSDSHVESKSNSIVALVDLRPAEIAEAVSYLLSNDHEREQMGRMGRHIVEQKFTLQEMSARFEGVYERAVRG
jgi:glycosyltransferase involved in cell wall biosynthesis